jgi:hypothetical protein
MPKDQTKTPTPGSLKPVGSALTDAKKIQKATEFLQWMHDNCLAPDITAHDAVNTCRICRLIAELKAPNTELRRAGHLSNDKQKGEPGIA